MNQSENTYEIITALFERQNILSDAAEVQGIFCGMLSGGMPLENRDWIDPLADSVNQGEKFDESVKSALFDLYDKTCQQLIEADFALTLCLPDDAAPINDRGQALIKWVQGFMLGFGFYQADLTKCSEDVKEALEDFTEIARMDEHMNQDEESERALFEVMEYVRVSCMLCFNELGQSAAENQQSPKTVH